VTVVATATLVTPQALENLSWQPIDYLDSSNTNSLDGTHNKRENSRAFNTHVMETVLQNRTLLNYTGTELAKNDTLKHKNSSISILSVTASERSEIKEPVLVRSSTSHPSVWPREATATRSTNSVLANISATSDSHLPGKPEITEPILNPKTALTTPHPKIVQPQEISNTFSGNYHKHNSKWMPALNLNPPPVSNGQTWQHWITETTASNSVSMMTETPPLEDKSYDMLPSSNETNGESRRLTVSLPTKNSKELHPVPVTVQFFPERLAAILAQAERYARLTFSFPMAAISKLGYYKSHSSDSLEDDQVTSASSSRLYSINTQTLLASPEDSNRRYPSLQTQRRPKHFTTTRPTVGNVNTNPSSQNASSTFEKLRPHNGKTLSSPVTTEASYSRQVSKEAPIFEPKVDFFGKTKQTKDTTQNFIFVPYSYAYVSDDDDDATENTEMSRYIPLLRHLYTNHKSKYETQQSYDRSNNNDSKNVSEKSAVHIDIKQINSGRDGNTDYNKHFSIFHWYPLKPER
jgi:hypothetical protein